MSFGGREIGKREGVPPLGGGGRTRERESRDFNIGGGEMRMGALNKDIDQVSFSIYISI